MITKPIIVGVLTLALAACGDNQRAYFAHPEEPEAQAFLFERCLKSTQGPASTKYNDWDEAIEACNSYATDLSRYCPANATDCLPQYQRTREDVRAVLKEGK